MEEDHLSGHCKHVVPKRILQQAANRICDTYRVPRVTLKTQVMLRYHAYCMGTEIGLNTRTGRNYLTIAHELAHHIAFTHFPRAAAHGPVWMALYTKLASQLGVLPEEGMRAIARKHKVKIASAYVVAGVLGRVVQGAG
jgi:predicted SprT family Zn-dependent metalloprotease